VHHPPSYDGMKGGDRVYQFRIWQQTDLHWLNQAAAASAWEALSPEERAMANPQVVTEGAVERLSGALFHSHGTAIVATVGLLPVGFAAVVIGPDGTTGEMLGHILDLWVVPLHRRQGLGRAMHDKAEELLAAEGVLKIKTWTGLHNLPALRLATQAGYQPEGLIGDKGL